MFRVYIYFNLGYVIMLICYLLSWTASIIVCMKDIVLSFIKLILLCLNLHFSAPSLA